MCPGFVENYAGFVTVQFFLEIAEGRRLRIVHIFNFLLIYLSRRLPALYLLGVYKSREMLLRIGLFSTSASLPGGFSHGLVGWRWIFIVEEFLTIVVDSSSYFALPNSIKTAIFLRRRCCMISISDRGMIWIRFSRWSRDALILERVFVLPGAAFQYGAAERLFMIRGLTKYGA